MYFGNINSDNYCFNYKNTVSLNKLKIIISFTGQQQNKFILMIDVLMIVLEILQE